VGSGYRSDFTLPDVESKRGIDILDDRFGGQGAAQVGNIVFAFATGGSPAGSTASSPASTSKRHPT
jgi:hypothetical protein